jgi:hypothetical protein
MNLYKARENVTENVLLGELEAKSHNSDICDDKPEKVTRVTIVMCK